jgi:hypothetical protein
MRERLLAGLEVIADRDENVCRRHTDRPARRLGRVS